MSSIWMDFLYWGGLGMVNVGMSFLVYNTTRLDLKQRRAAQTDMSTHHPIRAHSLPHSFIYLSYATGLLNLGAAFMRLRTINFLDIPILMWLESIVDTSSRNDSEFMKLLAARWIVAMSDWTSLWLACTFFASACLNFATVRQLHLRERWIRDALLPIPTLVPNEKTRLMVVNVSLGCSITTDAENLVGKTRVVLLPILVPEGVDDIVAEVVLE
ncbi:hypothetical protein BJ165DRAFT_1436776 [Panaeolus papilionaceus]|nr:hypothetical protein BJ165DRAFT_1436776 [Panaeolus papilionaceus]